MHQLWQIILDADWAWRIAAWTLLVLGLVLLPWALFWDRPGFRGRPRERCLRCRYDMTGVPGEDSITCPECGRVARSRRLLRKTRRRWGIAALALTLLAGRYVTMHKDRAEAYGWTEFVPTSVLVVMLDPDRWYKIQIEGEILEDRFTDRFFKRLPSRLDTGPGWQRDVWTWQLSPTLDQRGP